MRVFVVEYQYFEDGFICGVFSTEKAANEAIPFFRRRDRTELGNHIVREFVVDGVDTTVDTGTWLYEVTLEAPSGTFMRAETYGLHVQTHKHGDIITNKYEVPAKPFQRHGATVDLFVVHVLVEAASIEDAAAAASRLYEQWKEAGHAWPDNGSVACHQ